MKLRVLMSGLVVLSFVVPMHIAAVPMHSASQSQEPVVWGMLSHNSGCVIFAEGKKTSGRFYGIAVTTKTVGKLTLIETQHYTFAQKEVLETQENMDALMQQAQKRQRQVCEDSGKVFARLVGKGAGGLRRVRSGSFAP